VDYISREVTKSADLGAGNEPWTEKQNTPRHGLYGPAHQEVRRETRSEDCPAPLCTRRVARRIARLFAMSEGDVVLWDIATLQELDRMDAPEPAADDGEHCFSLASAARGMWFFGQSGKGYGLVDRTGKLMEEVELPFGLLSLLRKP